MWSLAASSRAAHPSVLQAVDQTHGTRATREVWKPIFGQDRMAVDLQLLGGDAAGPRGYSTCFAHDPIRRATSRSNACTAILNRMAFLAAGPTFDVSV